MHVFVVVACGAALHGTPCRIVAVGQHFFLSTGPVAHFQWPAEESRACKYSVALTI